MRGASSTFGGSGRSEKREGIADLGNGIGGVEVAVEGVSVMGGVSFERPSGVGTRERVAGVPVAEGRGLFFDRGRDEGADRKSSGMSFHCSVALGSGVELEGVRLAGMRGGAEMDLGGGGGRFGAAADGGGGGGVWMLSLLAAGFFSHPDNEDWSMFVVCARVAEILTVCSNGIIKNYGVRERRECRAIEQVSICALFIVTSCAA